MMTVMKVRIAFPITIGMVVIISLFSLTAVAQEDIVELPSDEPVIEVEEQPTAENLPPTPVATQKTCQPPCRHGYTCIDGVCKSLCNPPCPASQRCTPRGQCIVFRPGSLVGPPQQGTTQQKDWAQKDSEIYSNEELLEKSKKKKTGGAVMLFTGVLMLAGSAGCYISADEGEDGKKALGIMLDIVGSIALISGIVLVVQGNKMKEKAQGAW